MKTLFSFFLLLFSLAALAQDEKPKTPEKPKRRLSFSELFKEIEECKDTVYRLENAVLYYDSLKDEDRWWNRLFPKEDTVKIYNNMKAIILDKKIVFSHVLFEETLQFWQKLEFKRGFVLENCTWNEVFFYKCKISNLKVNNCKGKVLGISRGSLAGKIHTETNEIKELALWYSTITDDIISDQYSVYIEDCILLGNNVFSKVTKDFIMFNTHIKAKKGKKQPLELTCYNPLINEIQIMNCRIEAVEKESSISLGSVDIKRLYIGYDTIKIPIRLVYMAVEKHFGFHENTLLSVNLQGSSFPIENSNIIWKPFADHKLEIYETTYADSPVLNSKTDTLFSHMPAYIRLIASYNQLLSVFKFRGDMESYNACYVEMKNLETRKSAYEYRKNPSLKTFLDWQMNEFLHTFSDYGTDYVKSLIYAFYVILGFSLIYFIFPSQEDNLSKNRFLKFFTKAIQYFRTDTQLTDFQQEKRKEELEKLENFRQNLLNAQTEIPRIISLLGKPFYYQNLYFTEFALWLLHRTDLAKGKWSEIPAKRKLFLGTLVSVYFVFYVCNGLFMRALNALALSLNFFTTLGYGEMQAKGWIKYLAVLEGAVGWFLLTVFSASLVSQLLQ